jgi:virginiamycin B lyase
MRKHLVVIAAALFVLCLQGCASHTALPRSAVGGLSSNVVVQGDPDADRTTFSYISLPAPYTFPFPMLVSPTGEIFVGEFGIGGTAAGIAQINNDGTITEFAIQPLGSTPFPDTFDGEGNLWFANCGSIFCSATDSFGTLSPNGTIVSHPLPNTGEALPRYGALDTSGNVWFVLTEADALARVAPSGVITEFSLPGSAQGGPGLAGFCVRLQGLCPNDIALGPDGALWATEVLGNAIVRIAPNGSVTNTYTLPAPQFAPYYIAAGADGNLWFTNFSSIIRMSTSGEMTSYPLPFQGAPATIRPAAGGFVFTDLGTNAVGFIDYGGNATEWPIAYADGQPSDVQFAVQDPYGTFYFADVGANRIGKITLGKKGVILPASIPLTGAGATQLVGVAVLGDRGPYTATVDNPSVASVSAISGFPLNFMVTAVGPGNAMLTIKGKGEPMHATITVTATAATQALQRRGVRANRAL